MVVNVMMMLWRRIEDALYLLFLLILYDVLVGRGLLRLLGPNEDILCRRRTDKVVACPRAAWHGAYVP